MLSNIKHLVIGLGEVGRALQKHFSCDGCDEDIPLGEQYDVVHICFPYSERFSSDVVGYTEVLGPHTIVIHSTVPVGTTTGIRNHLNELATYDPNNPNNPTIVVHSPVRGKHPFDDFAQWTKYIGGPGGQTVQPLFPKTVFTPRSETTEALKIFDTEIYRLNILAEKAIWDFCEAHSLDYSTVYTHANKTYNEGYAGTPYKKYELSHQEGAIGGHCVIPNSRFIDLLELIWKSKTSYEPKERGGSPDGTFSDSST